MFHFCLPHDELLKRYIRLTYIYTNTGPQRDFLVLPFPGCGMTIFENATFDETEENVFVTRETGQPSILLHLMQTTPAKIIIKEGVRVFMMVWEPLGINHFIPHSLAGFLEHHPRNLIPYHLYAKNMDEFKKEIAATDLKQKMNAVWRLLRNNYHDFTNDLLQDCIRMLSDPENILPINKICRQAGTSERTLNRLFQEHLCIAPIQFRRICQFRHSLELKSNHQYISINHLAAKSNYSDSAYLVKVYKEYAGLSPRRLFEYINTPANNYLFYILQQERYKKLAC